MFESFTGPIVKIVSNNAAAILTAGGVAGTVGTGVVSYRAGYRSHERLHIEEQDRVADAKVHTAPGEPIEIEMVSVLDKAKLLWPEFVPPIIVGGVTIASIVMSNRVSAGQAAALAAAYSASQTHRDELRAKIEEKLSPKKAEEALTEVGQKRADERPPAAIIIGHGDVPCYDVFSDRYFKSSAETILRAERTVQNIILRESECSLGRFYKELGLPKAPFDDIVGWNLGHGIKVQINAMLINDSEPCLMVEFEEFPMTQWQVDYGID